MKEYKRKLLSIRTDNLRGMLVAQLVKHMAFPQVMILGS